MISREVLCDRGELTSHIIRWSLRSHMISLSNALKIALAVARGVVRARLKQFNVYYSLLEIKSFGGEGAQIHMMMQYSYCESPCIDVASIYCRCRCVFVYD